MKKKTNGSSNIKKAAVLGAVAGAAYMLMGPNGKKNQAKLKAFAGKVKKEVKKDAKLVMKTATKAKSMIMKDAKIVKQNAKKTIAQIKKTK